MPTTVYSGAVFGLDGNIVEVEIDISPGLPTMIIVGLPDTAVQEAKERVRSAVKNSGFGFPKSRVAINLAPADTPKSGSLYDLPIAVAILSASDSLKVSNDILRESLWIGELALDGRVRPINGALPIAAAAVKQGYKRIFLPAENANEAALVEEIEVFPVSTLSAAVAHIESRVLLDRHQYKRPESAVCQKNYVDFADIAGQKAAKRALEIAAAGHHNVLFAGPPGSGKTMLAKALQGILPQLSSEEYLEVTKIYSIAGLLKGSLKERPFRNPHHTSSRIALIGGGSTPKPGEVTLAHKGVLFLDEFPEFPRSVLESLRQPLEDGTVTVSRISATLSFPAEFVLVAAQNPCPCGQLGNTKANCQCSDHQIHKYKNRISGPILDRIDLIVEVPQQSYQDLKQESGPRSDQIRERVEAARLKQRQRFGIDKPNARLKPADMEKYCALDQQTEQVVNNAVDKLGLSARSYHRVLKVARTVADLEQSENIALEHLTESLQYRWRQEF